MIRTALVSFALSVPAVGQWTVATPAVDPGDKSRPAMAYDTGNAQTVLFGGQSNAGLSSDTWLYNGTTWSLAMPSTVPPARRETAMAYDIARGVVVMFGGRGATGELSDTWEWNGTDWTLVSMTGPSRRQGHSMCYDAGSGKTVMFGGSRNPDFCFPVLTDTWEWDGATWTQIATASTPVSTVYGGMVYDFSRDVVVYYGGTDCGVTDTNTYEYDGANWVDVSGTVGTGPSYFPPSIGLARFGMVYDVNNAVTILYGGRNEGVGGFANGTWKYDGIGWTEVLSGMPSTRTGFAMTMDDARGVVVLYGGTNVAGLTTYFQETWEYACPSAPAASFARSGTGCGGTGGPPPLLNSTDLPTLGSTFTLDYTGPSSITPVSSDRPFLLVGFASLNVPVPLLTPLQPANCTLYVQPAVTIPSPLSSSSTGYETSFDLVVPQNSSLLGLPFFAQVATVFVRTSAGSGTFVRFTNRAEMVIGT